jgi:hypothetical protein
MSISKEVARHLRELFIGDNWTWSCMKDALSTTTWKTAVRRPIRNGNNIAMLVYHMNFYLNVVYLRFTEDKHGFEYDESFNVPEIRSEADWQALVAKTWADMEALAVVIENLPDEKLLDPISPVHGSNYKNFHGMIEHCYYHLGQIVLLKKMIEKD